MATPGRQKAQAKYNSQPLQVKRREGRNKARALMMKAGKVSKGDGKDVDHKNHDTFDNRSSNLQAQSLHVNRKDGGPDATMVNTLLNPPSFNKKNAAPPKSKKKKKG